jgi:hypothetical protein
VLSGGRFAVHVQVQACELRERPYQTDEGEGGVLGQRVDDRKRQKAKRVLPWTSAWAVILHKYSVLYGVPPYGACIVRSVGTQSPFRKASAAGYEGKP